MMTIFKIGLLVIFLLVIFPVLHKLFIIYFDIILDYYHNKNLLS